MPAPKTCNVGISQDSPEKKNGEEIYVYRGWGGKGFVLRNWFIRL